MKNELTQNIPINELPSTRIARHVSVNGIVQGVGFRPFVYRLAENYRIKGHVANTPSGVSIHVEGVKKDVDSFIVDLTKKKPPLAYIDLVEQQSAVFENIQTFEIKKSRASGKRATLISPDIATCDECLAEVHSVNDRRYRYPFTNCTNCGPRYTILKDLPYDRIKTSMHSFSMCSDCDREYHDVYDRRFHSQPNACSRCGPNVSLYDRERNLVDSKTPLRIVIELVKKGHIVAVKGLGGFHLVADARNDETLLRLREKKHRPDKPFAVMSAFPAAIERYAHVEPLAAQALASSMRPIMLLPKKAPFPLSKWVSPDNAYIGCMLSYTPLHELLFDDELSALVMTSGNLSGEPLIIDNEPAFKKLSHIADYFLIHNRDIVTRNDDSVAMIAYGRQRFIRRSRGYVPAPIYLENRTASILACGPEQKNTVCLTKKNQAFLSQHIGDVTNLESYTIYQETIDHLKRILDVTPEVIAYDAHPDYLTSTYALEQNDVNVKIAVQHHHAHVVGCMAENRISGPVIGIAFDGTGFGADGAVWGGEIMIVEPAHYERIGHLEYVAMPGGNTAVREPWRMAVSYLFRVYGKALFDLNLPFFKTIPIKRIELLAEMIQKEINAPLTSSMGRLFDGVSALIGLRSHASFEGQAAMELECLMEKGKTAGRGVYDYAFEWQNGHILLIEPLIRGIMQDVAAGVALPAISAGFHYTLIQMVVDLCEKIRKSHSLNRVVLSGGVFQNRIFLSGLLRRLEHRAFETYSHALAPTNDGGIALGQALVAAALI